jgi:hypothetical protein
MEDQGRKLNGLKRNNWRKKNNNYSIYTVSSIRGYD